MTAPGPHPAVRAILEAEGLDPSFPDDVEAEAAALVAAPGLDDPALADQEGISYVTVDGPGTRDLDQALHLERDGDGFRIRYAIADAAHYVRPGTALFAEALRRGTSFYLPGITVPMLPRPLSEGAVSLNPGVRRRALVFEIDLDAGGQVRGARTARARIRSRAKLTFDEVQALLDDPAASPLGGRDFTDSLLLLPVIGTLRQLDAAARQVIRFHREELQITHDGEAFTLTVRTRHPVERYNEQLSLLCNSEGGRLLCAAVGDDVSTTTQGIYRVHPAPPPERLAELAVQIDEVIALHGLDPAAWRWQPDTPLAIWIDALPGLAADDRLARIARAIERQAVMVNVRSGYSVEPGAHHGVGLEPYARFSAPMREIVGVFVHKELVEGLGLGAGAARDDAALRDQVLDRANAARDRQRRLTDLTNRRVIDEVFAPDLALPRERRPVRAGTVMGVTSSKIHVSLDGPPIDVKVYVGDAGKAYQAWMHLSPGKAALLDEAEAPVVAVGDPIGLRVIRRDEARDRWVLAPIARTRPAQRSSRGGSV